MDDFTAADLLVMLEHLRDKNVPLHKVSIYIECEDSFYDGETGQPVYDSHYSDRVGQALVFYTSPQ